jgi:hypothetical protein
MQGPLEGIARPLGVVMKVLRTTGGILGRKVEGVYRDNP